MLGLNYLQFSEDERTLFVVSRHLFDPNSAPAVNAPAYLGHFRTMVMRKCRKFDLCAEEEDEMLIMQRIDKIGLRELELYDPYGRLSYVKDFSYV